MDHPNDPKALEARSWSQIAGEFARDPRLLMAISPLEDHGPSLPIGTGLRIASAVVDAASASTGILRAPALPYGVSSPRGEGRAGVSPLARKTLHRSVNELLGGWEEQGVREFILVTAHGSESHLDALLMALTSEAKTTVFDLGSVSVRALLAGNAEKERIEAKILSWLAPEVLRRSDPDRRYDLDAEVGESLFSRYVDALIGHLVGTASDGKV